MALKTRSERQAAEQQDEDVPVGPPRNAPEVGEWGARSVRVVWGEEKITAVPGSFSTVSVGPFEVVFQLREGEALEPKYEAAMAELSRLAEVERERKVANFVATLRRVAQRTRDARDA